MHRLLESMRQQMDIVIIDTPPMAMFSDAELLADEADLSLLVIRQDCVSVSRINDAVDALNQCSAHLLGCIFNDVRHFSLPMPGRHKHGYRQGYGYRYGYGYGYGYGSYGYYGYDTNNHSRNAGKDSHGRTKT